MESETPRELIPKDSPVFVAAKAALDAMHEYFRVANFRRGTIWLEDDAGNVLVFTRGEQRNLIMKTIEQSERCQPAETKFFKLEKPDAR